MLLNQITFTRFIAALTVVFFHYGNQAFPLTVPYLREVISAGPIAVNYFYLLSGFIMAIAYYQPHNQTAFSSKQYWLARFARIYPVYLVALLLIAVGKLKQPDISTALFLNLSLLQSWIPDYALSLNSPGWSLSVEAFFYLCFPLLLLFIYRYRLKNVIILGALLWLGTQILHTALLNSDAYHAKNTLHSFIYYHPLMHLNAFISGVIVGVLFKDRQQWLNNNMSRYSTAGIILTATTVALLIAFRAPISQILGIKIAFTNGLLAPLFLLFIVFLSLNKGRMTHWLSHKWLILLGEASFSLYILQRPVHGIYEKTLQKYLQLPDATHFYLYLLLLILISIASYKLFETPARHLIRSWPTRKSNKKAAVSQTS